MSRTYKDQPSWVRFRGTSNAYRKAPDSVWPGYQSSDEWIGCGKMPGFFPKRKKLKDTEWRWMTTPSWWNNLFHTRPKRRAGQQWERNLQKINLLEIEDYTDSPDVSKKPHKYYW